LVVHVLRSTGVPRGTGYREKIVAWEMRERGVLSKLEEKGKIV